MYLFDNDDYGLYKEKMNMQLLKRPRPLPIFDNERQNGIYTEWKVKGFYYRNNGLPRFCIKAKVFVQYSTLIVQGSFPKFTLRIPLVSIGFVESQKDILDVRGCTFRLLLVGVVGIDKIKDELRFLIVRQRIPHAILGKSLDWQLKPVKNDRMTNIPRWSPLNCFRFF